MQIFELTQTRKSRLNEYDPSRSPPGTPNYAAGGAPQMTATPGTTAKAPVTSTSNYSGGQQTATPAPAPTPAAQLARDFWSTPDQTSPTPATTPDYSGGQQTVTPTVKTPAAPTLAPTPAPTPAPNYSAGNYNQTSNAPTAAVPATNTPMPSNMSATGTPAAATPAAVNPDLAAASTVGLAVPKPRGVDVGGAIARALMKHNANSAGLGYMLPKEPDTEVYVDRSGKVFVGSEPYDAKNPVHQRAAGIITVAGKPYDPNNPQHRVAYLAFKNNAGRGDADAVKIDANGRATVFGQPFNPSNPAHVKAWQQHTQGSPVKVTPVAAQPGQQQPAAPEATPPRGYRTTQPPVQPARPPATTESLTWSRNFDPSRTLLKKMKPQ